MSLLLMDSDDEKQHFSLQNIMDQEKKKKKKKLKKKKDPSRVVEDNFQVIELLDKEDPHLSFECTIFNMVSQFLWEFKMYLVII